MSRDWQKEAMKLEDERSKVLAELRDQVSQLLQQYAAEKERADIAEAKSDYWERNYYALQREYNEYRTIYPTREGGGCKVTEWKCFVCGADVTDYKPEYCCYVNTYGTEYPCGCMGLPIEPPLCSLACTEKVFGKAVEEFPVMDKEGGV